MPCYRPLQAYKSLTKFTDSGRSFITFNVRYAGIRYDHIDLPCGQCIGCRIERSRQWALRCVHESSLFKNNCFITLTFNDENLNKLGTLVKSDFQKFMKRLRKKFKGVECVQNGDTAKKGFPIRYFHCGEYGSELQRPHHHACIFNFDFKDKLLWSIRDGVRLYRSEKLERLWPYGFCTVGDVNFQSAAYVARYITKKINGDMARLHYSRIDKITGEMFEIEPEYITMSRRPGIGKKWFEKFSSDIYPKDFITCEGKKFRSPKYYDKLYDEINPNFMEDIKEIRKLKAAEHEENNKPRRLVVREKVLNRKVDQLKRGMEL